MPRGIPSEIKRYIINKKIGQGSSNFVKVLNETSIEIGVP